MKKLLSLLTITTLTAIVPAPLLANTTLERTKRDVITSNSNNDYLSLEQIKNILCIFNNDIFVEKLRQDVLEIFNLRSYIEKNSSFSTYKVETITDNNMSIKKYLTINNKKYEIHNLHNFYYIKTDNQTFLIYDDKIKEIKFSNLNTGTFENILKNIYCSPNYHMFFNIKETSFYERDLSEKNEKWGWIIETSNGKYSLTYNNWLNNSLATKIDTN